MENEKPVFVFDPFGQDWQKLDKSLVETRLRKKKGALSRFLSSKNIGVLVSTKPGQSFLRQSFKLRNIYPTKNFYYIISNNIDFSQLENFNFVECWVNTACPRIGIDDIDKFQKPVVNLDDIAEGSLKTSIAFREYNGISKKKKKK
jgi:2-(3-amino-3-carboxypropyl)histidine synthase